VGSRVSRRAHSGSAVSTRWRLEATSKSTSSKAVPSATPRHLPPGTPPEATHRRSVEGGGRRRWHADLPSSKTMPSLPRAVASALSPTGRGCSGQGLHPAVRVPWGRRGSPSPEGSPAQSQLLAGQQPPASLWCPGCHWRIPRCRRHCRDLLLECGVGPFRGHGRPLYGNLRSKEGGGGL